MPRYLVQTPLQHNGKRYAPGDVLVTTDKAAQALPAGTVTAAPAEPKKAASTEDAK